MRVIGGTLGGRKLRSARGRRVRPTSSRAREALFDILGSCQGLRVLDLFAGSGALGIEALSRGADFAVFVDRSSRAIRMIRLNLSECGLDQRSRVIQGEANRLLRKLAASGERFSLILIDPPYEKGLVKKALRMISETGILMPDSMVVTEHRASEPVEDLIENLECFDQRRYGDTAITFWRTCR
ncbi:MAG: 16S rRNA (guanine(966)-N(2))-methyltransferase RsmD [Deltaproteobacteria bacterium]|nr:16S rRNA (guanine(966)-N(2))-methyltransferase RsmD [Deltaproteobacteria bacterium]